MARRSRIALGSCCLVLAACGAPAMRPSAQNPRPAADAARQMPVAHAASARRIGFGTIDDALSPGDPLDERGRHVRSYELDLEAGQRVRLRVPAGAIDPMLRVEGPGDFAIENDDVLPGVLDALLDFVVPVTGTYRIGVIGVTPGTSGAFQLRAGTRSSTGTGPRVELGARISGALGDATLDPDFGSGAALVHFEASGGSIVHLRVTSQAFDTVVTVLGPNGQSWFNDDANDVGDGSERALDSTLVIAVPETGIYQVVVTSYRDRGRGPFSLATRVRPPVIVAADEIAPAAGFAGSSGAGRILGLYAGITEYTSLGRLYGCADDARLLGEAMRAAHLQRPDEQVVLTDAQATRGAFLDGLRSIAARATTEDVVLVFWSGHGNVQAAPAGSREIDGLDETIEMIDGSLLDDAVASAVDAIHAGTVVLALDSCHSGGFADDVVARPGRMGLFSSDEDVLSDIATPRRAGGYLSYYLRRAVLGHGDHKPRDGVLYAGELVDYVSRGFADDEAMINPAGRIDPAQHLVSRRGSIAWTDVLWVYPRGADLRLAPVPDLALESAPLQ